MRQSLMSLVKQRAHHCCEYCLLPDSVQVQAFQIDHIIAQKHNGQTVDTNLAYACPGCNQSKGANIAGIDPDRAVDTPVFLFDPRKDVWREHFILQDSLILGITSKGRVTVDILRMNNDTYRSVRECLLEEGLYPPSHYQP